MAVAERRVSVEFVFDRAGDQMLAHAYRVLVPERRNRTTHGRNVDERSKASPVDEGEQRPALGA
jgi:hypothetical protein